MADQSTQQAMSVLRVVIQVGNIAVTTVTQVLDTLLKENKNPLEEEMRKAFKDGKALGIEMSGEDAEKLRRIMAEKGFGRDPMHPMQRCLVDKDGLQKSMFFVLNRDEALARECLEELYKEKRLGGVISPQDMLRHSQGDTCSVEMSPECAVIMAKRAEQYGLKFSVEGPSTSKNGEQRMKVYFATKERQLFNRVQMETMCDIEGRAGAIYREMTARESKYQIQAMNTMLENRTPNGEQVRNGTMLVNNQGVTLESKGGNLILLQPDGTRNVFKRADMDKKNVRVQIERHFSYGEVSLLSPEQAKRYMESQSPATKANIMMEGRLQPTGGIEPITILSKQQLAILKHHEEEREIIARKLQEEYPGYTYMTPQLYDNSPVGEFIITQNHNAEAADAIGKAGQPLKEMLTTDNPYVEHIVDSFTEPEPDEITVQIEQRIFHPEEIDESLEDQLGRGKDGFTLGGQDGMTQKLDDEMAIYGDMHLGE